MLKLIILRKTFLLICLFYAVFSNSQNSQVSENKVLIEIESPMSPPTWALLEQELLKANTAACKEFFNKYFDERGYLMAVERWGGNDGPDDAIENVADWPTLHMLGASDDILILYKKAWEGHLRQYTEAKTVDVPFAREGMYYKEFPVMMDWMHNGEGLRVFNLQGLSDPYDIDYQKRVRRFAGFYMNEDVEANNYDPEYKIIKSMFNGSKGPLMRKATSLDWAGDPIQIKNRFKAGHGESTYEEMLEHFKDYTDIIGDHPQNMSATTLAVNAFMLTGESKYREWLLEYVDAWLDRTKANNGIIPSNIGLDGTIGGSANGKWYGSTYGWGFSPIVPQTGKVQHRTRVYRGIIGFCNAVLLTGDLRYINAWGDMLDKVNSNNKKIDGKIQYPHMYGDNGWYAFSPEPVNWGALDCYFFTCSSKDRARLGKNNWISFLEGDNPNYPEEILRRDLDRIRNKYSNMLKDDSTPDTRLADDPMKYNPATVDALRELMLAGLDPGRGGAPLHSRLRYFDSVNRRAGIPSDTAALIDEMTADHVAVTLINLNQIESRELVVQTGAYAEHQCLYVEINDKQIPINQSSFTIHLLPGTGTRLVIKTKRYVNKPTLKFPWDIDTVVLK
ncbi:hypothetical protein VP395_03740 [Mariniflexile soesokkakense]|uniref:Uncharacterized protein n=1 Tax=Mariniflexile soesokkakense TaxID=1343160 RepID=A0ABV0A8D8_9FLAO